jgi:hypothetical protein
MSAEFRRWWTDQEGAAERLVLTRYATGLALMRATWHLPPGSLFTREGLLLDAARGHSSRTPLTSRQYEALRVVSLLSVGAWTLGCEHPAVKVAANLSSGIVHWRNARLHDEVWNYNSHLNVFLLALSCVGTGDKPSPRGGKEISPEVASALVAALQSYYGWIYFQAGLSKALVSGIRWLDGTTVRGSWAECGTPLGRLLSKADVRLAVAASIAALGFELSFFPLLFSGQRYWRALGLGSLAFHASTKATMDISFWHLSWLAVPLFIAEPSAEHKISRILGCVLGAACPEPAVTVGKRGG